MSSFGDPVKMRDDILPTMLDIYNHFMFIKKEKNASGEWDKFTHLSIKISCVLEDVRSLWDKTGIPHCLSSKDGERKISTLITKCKNLSKVPLARRPAATPGALYLCWDCGFWGDFASFHLHQLYLQDW